MLAIKSTRSVISAATLAVLLSSALCTASAADTSERTATVSLHGLDLNTLQDQAVLRHRLHVAASQVCLEPGESPILADDGFQECAEAAYKHAWTKVEPLIAMARSQALFSAGTHSPQWPQPRTIVASSNSPSKSR
jgi:UrcA family protein